MGNVGLDRDGIYFMGRVEKGEFLVGGAAMQDYFLTYKLNKNTCTVI